MEEVASSVLSVTAGDGNGQSDSVDRNGESDFNQNNGTSNNGNSRGKQGEEKKRKKDTKKKGKKSGMHHLTEAERQVSAAQQESGQPRSSADRIRPRNWGYTTYLDRVFGMRCFEDIVRLRVFPDAKDISESYGVLQAAIRRGGLATTTNYCCLWNHGEVKY